jgi:hypothetical protein
MVLEMYIHMTRLWQLQGTSRSNATNKIIPTNIENQKAYNLVSNSDFSILNNKSGLPLYWNDSLNICRKPYTCKINGTDRWDARQSFQLSINLRKRMIP